MSLSLAMTYYVKIGIIRGKKRMFLLNNGHITSLIGPKLKSKTLLKMRVSKQIGNINLN